MSYYTNEKVMEITVFISILTRAQGCKNTWLQGSQQTRFDHSPLIKSKGRDMNGSEIRKEFISVRPIPETPWTSVSKTVS